MAAMTYRKVGGLHHVVFRWWGFSFYWRKSKLKHVPLLITYGGL
jgi:hypothetical protein